MRSLLPLLLLGCPSSPPPDESASQATEAKAPEPSIPTKAPEAPAVPANRRYVLGSSLNLRAEPDGKVIGKLVINSPVTELETRETWSRVKVGNGKEGWVGTEFLGTEVITVEDAVEQAEQTDELSWWQRAAAISPDRDVLEGLAEAYRKAGKPKLAAKVDEQLRWPGQLLLAWQPYQAPPAGTTLVEWSRAGYGRAHRATVPKAAWRRYGLEETDVWWVLPSRGPAVKAKAVRMSHDAPNDCSGEWGRNLWLEHEPFAEGVVAVAAWRGKPPESWMQDLQPKSSRSEAEGAIRAKLKLKGQGKVEVLLGPSGNGWAGYARVENGRFNELGMTLYDQVDVRWMPAPKGVTIGSVQLSDGVDELLTERDVLGTGKPVRIEEDGCATLALDGSDTLKSTLYRCCGC